MKNRKTLLSDKTKWNEKITLAENETVTAQDEQISKLLNLFSSNTVQNLKITKLSNTNPLSEKLFDPTLKAILLKYKNRPSIAAIRNANNNSHFHFNEVSVEEVYKEIRKSNPRKSALSNDTAIRLLKENTVTFTDYICRFFNESLKKSTFPSILKNANITPVFKKWYRGSIELSPCKNFTSDFQNVWKLLCKQIKIFIDPLLSKYQYGFGKGFSAQHCLLVMLEKWKNAVDWT